MKRFLFLSIAALVSVAPVVARAQAVAPVDLVKQAVSAMGGVEALRVVKGVILKANAQFWEPQQSYIANGEPRFIGDSKLTITWDGEKNLARSDWDRDLKYPLAEKIKYSEIATSMLGDVSTAKQDVPMSNIRFAAYVRELERASPVLLLKALDAPKKLSPLPDQILDGEPRPSVAFTDGDANFTILFDRTSKLPVAVRSLDDDAIYGDVNYDLVSPIGSR